MIFFYFCSWKWLYFICSCSITNTVISLVAHKLYQILINNQEKFMTRSSKLKVHKANSHSISSHPIKFFTDILFSSLVSFAFCFLDFLFFKKIKNIYIMIHIRLCGQVSDFRFPETRLLSFLVSGRMILKTCMSFVENS